MATTPVLGQELQIKCWKCKHPQAVAGTRRQLKGKTVSCDKCGSRVIIRTLLVKRFITVLVWGDVAVVWLVTIGLWAAQRPVAGTIAFFIGLFQVAIGGLLVDAVSYACSKATHHDLPTIAGEDPGWNGFPSWPKD